MRFCTAIVDGAPVRTCITPVSAVAGKEIVTLEGLGTPANRIRFRRAFIDEQAAQCGFCLNGVILTAKAFLDKNPHAAEAEILQALGRAVPVLHARPDATGNSALREEAAK